MSLKEKYLLVSLTINKVVEESFDLDYIKDRKEALTFSSNRYTILVVAGKE